MQRTKKSPAVAGLKTSLKMMFIKNYFNSKPVRLTKYLELMQR